MMRRAVTLLLVVFVALSASYSRATLDRLASMPEEKELLYLPSGKHLRVTSLGHTGLMADMIYIWAIQYYSNYDRDNRRQYVEHIFNNVITELDPNYIDAYWMGSLILILEIQDVDAGLAMLKRGVDRNPDSWLLAYLAGWECYHAKRFECAEEYFQKASSVPNAPTAVKRMHAGVLGKRGGVEGALQVWEEILEDPDSDELSIRIAERKVSELIALRDTAALQALVKRFQIENGRFPAMLGELVQRAYIRELPRHIDGRLYAYDAARGQVTAPVAQALGDR